MEIYAGLRTDSSEKTIYKYVLSESSGKVCTPDAIQAGKKVLFFLFSNDRRYLYTLHEIGGLADAHSGHLRCFCKSSDGNYVEHSSHLTGGGYPRHMVLSRDGAYLFVSNSDNATLSAYALAREGAVLGQVQQFNFIDGREHISLQSAVCLHQTVLSPCGRFLYMTNPSNDSLYQFAIGSDIKQPLELINVTEVEKGTGVSAIAYSDSYEHLYVVGEHSRSILVFFYSAADGSIEFHRAYSSGIGGNVRDTGISEIIYFREHVYLLNRRENSLIIFSVPEPGVLQELENVSCQGRAPQYAKIFPDAIQEGRSLMVVANGDSNSLAIFTLSEGRLTFRYTMPYIIKPSCIA